MRLRPAHLLWICAVAVACDAPTDPAQRDGPVQSAADYLETVLSIAEEHSIRRHQTDWAQVRRETLLRAEGAQDAAGTHAAIRFLLAALGDGHSAFIPDQDKPGLQSESTVRARRVAGRAALVELYGSFGGGGLPEAGQIQRAIAGIDGSDVCGWVVDLRGNGGGDLWPQLAGLGPVLGDGTAGAFVDADGHVRSWSYRDGAAGFDDAEPVVRLAPYRTSTPQSPVAVLIGPGTASSGEALASAFRGLERSRSFGTATRGLSTANRGFFLSDGSLLVLTVARLMDRTGAAIDGPLEPDAFVTDGPGDPVLEAALSWIERRSGCDLAGR